MAPVTTFSDLHRALVPLVPLSATDFAQVVPLLSTRAVRAGEHLLRAGERATQALFVRRGLLREYYLDDAGREATRTFCAEGELSGSLADLLSFGPAMVSIEVLEPGEVVQFTWAAFDALTHRSPVWLQVARRHAEVLVLRKVKREFEMLTLGAAERYRRFIAERPNLEARVSKLLVASYLGITPVHLSRILAAARRPPAPPARRRRS